MTDQSDFTANCGDLVELKSGGPALVVRSVEGEAITVDWFDKTTARSAVFKLAQLQVHVPDKPYMIVMGGVALSQGQKESQ